jgi:hypothetical protein
MSDRHEAQRCDFCKIGSLFKSNQELSFKEWTDKGYVFCCITIPVSVCDQCYSKSWDEDVEKAIRDAVRLEYEKLP